MAPPDERVATPSRTDLTASRSNARPRDPYADLLRDTRGLRREQAAARETWFAALVTEHKEETLFELEMLMKGLVCFANPRNHPGPSRKTPVVALDFREELIIARQCISRVVTLCRQLLGSRDKAYVFQRYLETLLPEDASRARMNRDAPLQDTPEEALLHLRHAMTILIEVIDGVLRTERVPYRLFHSILVMVQREIQRNQFFNPLIALEFRPEFDRIRSPLVLHALQTVESEGAHRVVALSYLACFRMMHYAQLIQSTCQDPSAVRRAYVLLAVLRSDARAIIEYLRTRASHVIADGFERDLLRVSASDIRTRYDMLANESTRLTNLRSCLEAVAAALRVEVRGIYEHRVPTPESGVPPIELARSVRGAMGNLYDGLQTAITQLTVAIRGEVDPGDIFETPIARQNVGERMRQHVWMFAQVVRAFVAKARATPEAPDRWASYSSYQYVREFLRYFRAMGYQLLTTEYPNLERFLGILDALEDADFFDSQRIHAAIAECESFQQFLIDMFDRISDQNGLAETPFDKRAAAETLRLYLGSN